MKKILFAFVFVFVFAGAQRIFAQVDTDFWFAVPYLVNGHDNSQTDGYGKICITSFADTAHITIEQPAVTAPNNPRYFAPITYTLPPYTSHDFNVMQGSISRSNQSGQGTNGIHITSDNAVSVYFAQINQNSEIYTLKGRNALGTSFLVPMQSRYGNAFSASPTIEIVASENNTQVSITTPVTTFTQKNNTTWTVTLQKGETYTIRGTNSNAASHLSGTIITSDKPIAVNTTDDSVASTGQDLIGEQLVPAQLAGNEYIAIKHDSQNEFLYLATFPGHPISFQVNNGPIQTMAAGSSANIPLSNRATYIMADDDFVAFQMTADGGELGATVLPRLDCTGSYEVAYKKRFASQTLTLMVKTANTGAFSINGQAAYITFTPVPAAPQWSYCILPANSYFDQNGVFRISNSAALFHAAIMDYGGGTCSYGYFSGYNRVELVPWASGEEFEVGDVLHMGVLNPSLFDAITWVLPDGSTISAQEIDVPILSADNGGTYTVTATSVEGCPLLEDSIHVNIRVNVPFECPDPQIISDEVTLCDTLLPYVWRGRSLSEPGLYADTVRYSPQEAPDMLCDQQIYVLRLLTKHCEPPLPPEPALTIQLMEDHVNLCDGDDSFFLDCLVHEGHPHVCHLSLGGEVLVVDMPAPAEVPVLIHLPVTLSPEMLAQMTPLKSPLEMLVSFRDTVSPIGTNQLPFRLYLQYDPEAIFAQKWNNVLAIFSPEYGRYGLEFTGQFQWYKNGQPLPGETGSYLHLSADTFREDDYYQVETTRSADNVTMLTCPYYPHRPAYEASPASAEKVFRNGRIYIKVNDILYTPDGQRMSY